MKVSECPSHTATLSLPLYQQTPLHIAAGEGSKITSALLVEGGAEVNKKNKTGVSINTTVDFQVHVKEPCTQCLHTNNVYICVILYATLLQKPSFKLYVSLLKQATASIHVLKLVVVLTKSQKQQGLRRHCCHQRCF